MTEQTQLTEIQIKAIAREQAVFYAEYEKALTDMGQPPESMDSYTASLTRLADATTNTAELNREYMADSVVALERCATALEGIAELLRENVHGS
jgi:phage terminase Nu1 subunit (DNA packaging protein)